METSTLFHFIATTPSLPQLGRLPAASSVPRGGHPPALRLGNTEAGIKPSVIHLKPRSRSLLPLNCSLAQSQGHFSKHNCPLQHAPPGRRAAPALVFFGKRPHAWACNNLFPSSLALFPQRAYRKALLMAAWSPETEGTRRRAATAQAPTCTQRHHLPCRAHQTRFWSLSPRDSLASDNTPQAGSLLQRVLGFYHYF